MRDMLIGFVGALLCLMSVIFVAMVFGGLQDWHWIPVGLGVLFGMIWLIIAGVARISGVIGSKRVV